MTDRKLKKFIEALDKILGIEVWHTPAELYDITTKHNLLDEDLDNNYKYLILQAIAEGYLEDVNNFYVRRTDKPFPKLLGAGSPGATKIDLNMFSPEELKILNLALDNFDTKKYSREVNRSNQSIQNYISRIKDKINNGKIG